MALTVRMRRRWLGLAAGVGAVLVAANLSPAGAVAQAGQGATAATVQPAALYGWGNNGFQQVGNGNSAAWVLNPAVLNGFTGSVVQASAGYNFSMALRSDGTVWAWGINDRGQFGNGTTATTPSGTAVQVPGLSHVTQISAGDAYGMALTDDGSVWTWGENFHGQLGNGTVGNFSTTPAKVAGISGVGQIAAGSDFALTLRTKGSNNGEVWGWGANQHGELGVATGGDSPAPVRSATPYGIVQIAVGGSHSLALRSAALGGSVWSWGYNPGGAPGDGTDDIERDTPVLVMRNATAIGAGLITGFAIDADGRLYSWGWNRCGVLGNGVVDTVRLVPAWTGMTGVKAVDADYEEAAAIGTDGTLRRWGKKVGQIFCFDPGTYDPGPVPVPGISSVRTLDIDHVSLVVADAPVTTPPTSQPTQGPTKVTVPSVVDETCSQARADLQAVGLDGSCHGSGNFVGNQNPGEGAKVAPGTVISLTMSTSAP